MPVVPQTLSCAVAASTNAGATVAVNGNKIISCAVPALGSASTVRLQGSLDGTTWLDLKDTTPTTLQFASNSGEFLMDGDYCARFLGVSYVRPYLGTTQSTAVTFTFVLSQE